MKHYIYKTTNLITKKYYIGKHSSKNIETDTYLGSGKLLNRAIKKYGRHNFTRQILYQFESEIQAFAKEAELITEQMITQNDCYNSCVGGIGGRDNMVSVKDQHGNHLMVHKTDSRYINGQLIFNCTNMVYVIDESGNHKQITKAEFSANRDKFNHISKGNVVVRDSEGNTFCTTIKDQNYLSGKLQHVCANKCVVKDKDGTQYYVEKNDERVLSKEFIGIHYHHRWIHNKITGCSKHLPRQDDIPQGWFEGRGYCPNEKLLWIRNQQLKKQIRVSNDLIEEYILKGWKRGRFTNRGESSHNKGKRLFINKEGKREYI